MLNLSCNRQSNAEKDLSRREALWLQLLSGFGVFPITLKKRVAHVLGDILSRVMHDIRTVRIQNLSTTEWNPFGDVQFKNA